MVLYIVFCSIGNSLINFCKSNIEGFLIVIFKDNLSSIFWFPCQNRQCCHIFSKIRIRSLQLLNAMPFSVMSSDVELQVNTERRTCKRLMENNLFSL